MLEWNTKHFPPNLQSGLTLSNFRDVGGGFELRNQISHRKTVCIKRNHYLINYNRMRTQWTIKGNRDAGSSGLYDRGLHRYLRNFGGGVWTPETPLGTPLLRDTSMQKKTSSSVGYTIIISPVINIFPMLILFFFFGACNVWMSMSSKILQRKVLPLVSRSKYKRSNQLNQPTKTVITEEIITHLIHLWNWQHTTICYCTLRFLHFSASLWSHVKLKPGISYTK